MMNCSEYKKAITADPHFDGGGAHIAECAECRSWRAEMVAFDARIEQALRIDVPPVVMPELPAIDTVNVAYAGVRRGRRTGTRLALAASFALAAMIAFQILVPDVHYDSLADEVLAHVDHEPWAMRVTDVPVAGARLSRVTGAVATFDADAPLVTYAHTCVINGHDVPHLVIQGDRGPVMILLMPDEKVAGAIPLEDADSRGVILPVGGGSIAIVGGRDESIEKLEQSILNSVTWQT